MKKNNTNHLSSSLCHHSTAFGFGHVVADRFHGAQREPVHVPRRGLDLCVHDITMVHGHTAQSKVFHIVMLTIMDNNKIKYFLRIIFYK